MAKVRTRTVKRHKVGHSDEVPTKNRSHSVANDQRSELQAEINASSQSLSSGERSVLGVFRKYLMTPGIMLCFGGPDLESFRDSLTLLTQKGMLVVEKPRGGFSLSAAGYAAMKSID